MQDLFATETAAPLAERLRPRTLDEVVGQSHLLGPGKPLRVAFESRRPHSMILWGPPGVGKTTLARLMANAFGLEFIAISAVLGGVKDIRDAVERAQGNRARTGQPTVVFVDEVHRFNKAQQDAFLPHVESGLFVFIGATTENPSFEVIGALLSRAAVYVLQPLQRRGTRATDRPRAAPGARRPGDRRGRAPDADRSAPTAMRGGCSTRSRWIAMPHATAQARLIDCRIRPRGRCRQRCAASTRAARTSTTRSRRCTSRCAAPIRTRRCTG